MKNREIERENGMAAKEAEMGTFFKSMATSDKNAGCKLPDIAADLMQTALAQLPVAVLRHEVTPSNTGGRRVPLHEVLTVTKAAVVAWHQKMHDDATPTEVATFAHCGSCLRELPDDQSPHEYSRLEVGIHSNGTVIDVMCTRHDERVLRLPLATTIRGYSEWRPRWALHEAVQ